MAARKQIRLTEFDPQGDILGSYGFLRLLGTVYVTFATQKTKGSSKTGGPYYIVQYLHVVSVGKLNMKHSWKFGGTSSGNPNSQAELKARFESIGTFRALKYLFLPDIFYKNSKVGKKVIQAAITAAKQEMVKWKRSNTPFNYAQYLLAVRLNTEARTKGIHRFS